MGIITLSFPGHKTFVCKLCNNYIKKYENKGYLLEKIVLRHKYQLIVEIFSVRVAIFEVMGQ